MNTLAELERLEKAATPGPWTADLDKGADDEDIEACVTDKDVSLFISIPTGINYAVPEGRWTDEHEAAKNLAWRTARDTRAYRDADLIAASRNALGDLIKIARAVSWSRQDMHCVFCHAIDADEDEHQADCAWSLARKLANTCLEGV